MLDIKLSRRLAKPLRDFTAASVVFAVWACWMGWAPAPEPSWVAGAAHAGLYDQDAFAVAAPSGMWTAVHDALTLVVLGIAFSAMLTLDLWMLRHVRRAYARDWRRRL